MQVNPDRDPKGGWLRYQGSVNDTPLYFVPKIKIILFNQIGLQIKSDNASWNLCEGICPWGLWTDDSKLEGDFEYS